MPPQNQGNAEGQGQVVDNRPCFFRYITAITRTWGILTSIGVTLAAIVTFFEFVWILTKIACCKDDGNCCCTIWRIVVWLDNWKKSIFYILISLPLFSKASLGLIAGVLVIVLGIVYLLKSCKNSECVRRNNQQTQNSDTECPRADLVSHEAQTSTTSYTATEQSETTTKKSDVTETG
ncbi:hypothetical protein LSH36_96g05038 [Paralvinella palmiformis]|uniref:Uncharacterized protein n=1 Tax=Paralvinella palmiformis TaxID=53620 RepID=A0AAD9K0F2_9ANNE|nr:hypothetical protein LSH36_96g05038 [Paralvinella palmiformis]